MKVNKIFVFMLFILMIGFLFTSFSSSINKINKNEYEKSFNQQFIITENITIHNSTYSIGEYKSNPIRHSGTGKPIKLQGAPTPIYKHGQETGSNIQVTTSMLNESHPALGFDYNHNPFILFDSGEEVGDNDIRIIQSTDGGNTWDQNTIFTWDLITLNSRYDKNPEISFFENGTSAVGTHETEEQYPEEFIHHYYDITDKDTWAMFKFDISDRSTYVKETTITTLYNNKIILGSISDSNYLDYHFENVTKIWYNNNTGYGKWYFIILCPSEDKKRDCSNLCSAGDKSFILCWEDKFKLKSPVDDSIEKSCVYYVVDDFNSYPNLYFPIRRIGITGANLSCPNVCVKDHDPYIVFMNDVNGNQDIYCHNPRGISIVADSFVDEFYPKIDVFDDKLICVFIKNDSIHASISEDLGQNWSDPVMIDNKTYVTNSNDYELEGAFCAWTADSYDNLDIYFNQVISKPLFNIQPVEDGFGISTTIKNIGLIDAEDVCWSINIDAPFILYGRNVRGTMPIINSTDIVEIKSGFIFGFGPAIITIQIEDQKINQHAFIIGSYIHIIS